VCCGSDYEGLGASLAAPGVEGVMAKVYATVPGATVRIGEHGETSLLPVTDPKTKVTKFVETPCTVPEEVARQLQEEIDGARPNPDDPSKPIKIGSGPRSDIRVEFDAAPAYPRGAAKPEKGKEA